MTSRASSAMSLDPTAVASPASDDAFDEDYKPSVARVDEAVEPDAEQGRKARLAKLNLLLTRSTTYSTIMLERMEGQRRERMKTEEVAEPEPKTNKNGKRANAGDKAGSSKRAKVEDDIKEPDEATGEDAGKEKDNDIVYVVQPKTISGATLRPYQLAGVQWLASLYENGLNGILADEMGLGKTLQTIAFIAYLRERGVLDPFLVVSPLSVLHNWESEFQKFAPTIPTCVYHGTPDERKELIKTKMAKPDQESSTAKPKPKAKKTKKKGRASVPAASSSSHLSPTQPRETFPVVLTTYEMIIRDRNVLNKYDWCFVIVDEGHRLKNMNSRLIREIRTYPSANRLILTGTPLHNNLDELWSLLNFVLPNIFDDLTAFQEWFSEATSSHVSNQESIEEDDSGSATPTPGLSHEESHKLITTLHGILRPFLLRRLKTDVEAGLPPKKEYVLYAPLTTEQLEIYECVLEGGRRLREWIVSKMLGVSQERLDEDMKRALKDRQNGGADSEVVSEDEDSDMPKSRKQRKTTKTIDYNDQIEDNPSEDEDSDDDKPKRSQRFIDQKSTIPELTPEQLGREHAIKQAFKMVNNMHLQNKIMQLRKVCSHPFLFYEANNAQTGRPELSSDLINASGKMLLLNRLLTALFARGHKVLIFSQFTSMLDIIEDWATEFKGWQSFRIDGSTPPQERRAQMKEFNEGGEGDDACRLFLLSTRAGGLGINLIGADTVIFYDQDWNPQMDLQAQDRAHRIGQTRPVLIFRLVSAHTIETRIMERASQKRKLEALVIAKGKFKQLGGRGPKHDASISEMVESLLTLEAEKIDVVSSSDDKIISDEDLDVLLDRSPHVFTERGVGWTQRKDGVSEGPETSAKGKQKASGAGGKHLAFQVFERASDGATDGLANMLEE